MLHFFGMNKKIFFLLGIAFIIAAGAWWYSNQGNVTENTGAKQAGGQQKTTTKIAQKLFGKQTPSDPQGVINATGLELRGNGLQVLGFGASADVAVPRLTSMIGSPTKDTGWISSFSYGTCPGEKIRVVEWNRLRAFFGDTVFGTQKFFHWEYIKTGTGTQSPIIATEKGATLDMTKMEVLALYPQAQFFSEPNNQEYMHLIAYNDATHEYLGGILEGGKVSYLSGGIQCGE